MCRCRYLSCPSAAVHASIFGCRPPRSLSPLRFSPGSRTTQLGARRLIRRNVHSFQPQILSLSPRTGAKRPSQTVLQSNGGHQARTVAQSRKSAANACQYGLSARLPRQQLINPRPTFWSPCRLHARVSNGDFDETCIQIFIVAAVSYTHLDVYKRQLIEGTAQRHASTVRAVAPGAALSR